MKNTTRDIALIALFTALTCAVGFVRIPFGIINITLQSLMAVVNGVLLGAKRGTAAQAVYLLLGLAGLPLFSAGGGITYVFQPSFGYLLGMVATAFLSGVLYGVFVRKKTGISKPKHFIMLLAVGAISTVAIYLIGVPYQLLIMVFLLKLEQATIIINLVNLPIFFLIDCACVLVFALLPVERLIKAIDFRIEK